MSYNNGICTCAFNFPQPDERNVLCRDCLIDRAINFIRYAREKVKRAERRAAIIREAKEAFANGKGYF